MNDILEGTWNEAAVTYWKLSPHTVLGVTEEKSINCFSRIYAADCNR